MKRNLDLLIYKYRMIIMLLLVIIGFSLAAPQFFSLNTVTNVLWAVSMTGIMAAGAIYPILTGGIDLSIGTEVALTSVLIAIFLVDMQLSLFATILLVLIFGVVMGFVNGTLITVFKIPAFITTMAMMEIYSGMAMVISGGKTLPIRAPEAFLQIAIFKIFTIPLPVYIMLLIMAISFWVLHKSSFGRRIIAIGGNAVASGLSGINTRRIEVTGYILSSVCAVIGGIVLSSMNQQGKATLADGYEMNAISAIVLGGTSMAGGKGSIPGALFGVILIGLINCGMTMLNAPSSMHNIVRGLIIVVMVALDSFMEARSHAYAKGKTQTTTIA